MYIDPCTDLLNATYALSTNVLFIDPTSNAQRAKGKKRRKKLRENEKNGGIAFPRQIGTGSLCENRYERLLMRRYAFDSREVDSLVLMRARSFSRATCLDISHLIFTHSVI